MSFGEEEGRISQGEEGALDEGLSRNPWELEEEALVGLSLHGEVIHGGLASIPWRAHATWRRGAFTRGGTLIPCYAHLETKTWSLEMRSIAWGGYSLGVCFHGGRHSTISLSYLVWRFQIWGGCTWGGGRVISGEHFHLSDCSEVYFRARLLISVGLLWRGFQIRAF